MKLSPKCSLWSTLGFAETPKYSHKKFSGGFFSVAVAACVWNSRLRIIPIQNIHETGRCHLQRFVYVTHYKIFPSVLFQCLSDCTRQDIHVVGVEVLTSEGNHGLEESQSSATESGHWGWVDIIRT